MIMIQLSFSSHQKRRHDGWKNSGNHLFNSDKMTNSIQNNMVSSLGFVPWPHWWELNAFSTPHARESKTVFDSGFHIMDSGFQVLDSNCWWDSGIQSPGFQIPRVRFPRFWIPQAKISPILEFGLPYMV